MTLEEVADLKRRLLEAEETIRAIRTGEVDALVVGSDDSADIFDIGGDTESYRSFMEVMGVGAAALDQDGRVLYINSNLAASLGVTAKAASGRPIQELVGPVAGNAITDQLMAGGKAAGAQIQVGTNEFIVANKQLRIGVAEGWAVTFTDVTERVRAEAAMQSERAARAVIASANEAVLVCDRAGVITHANAATSNIVSGNPVGRPFADAVPLVFPGATGLMQAEDIVSMAVGGSSVQGIEVTAPNAPGVKDYLISAAPLQVGNDAISGCVITMVDLSQRKAAEQQQRFLMRELDHRVKNTLALVLSIAGRTLHHEETLEGFHRSFTGRIQALSATHNLLAENSWTELTVADVIQGELAPYLGGHVDRIILEGLDVSVTPRAAVAFGLVVHELTTNAAKYGALSRSEGRVQVKALDLIHGDGGALVIEWREIGGPEVAQPTRKGFGQSVIARSLQYTPSGGADIEYQPEGVRCVIRIPGEDIRDVPERPN